MSTTPDEASELRARAAAGGTGRGTGRGPQDENQDGAQDGLRRLLLGIGVVVLLGAMVAAAVTYSGGGGTVGQRTPPLRTTATPHGLAIGPSSAPVHVVVYEDLLQPGSVQLEMGSRDFLQTDAAAHRVYVEYRPVAPTSLAATRATNAFVTVLHASGPRSALRFHDLLSDRQATAGSPPTDAELVSLAVRAGAPRSVVETPIEHRRYQGWVNRGNAAASAHGVAGLPRVLVDGHALRAPTLGSTLDRLETMIARRSSS